MTDIYWKNDAQLRFDINYALRKHTLHGSFNTSTGPATEYLDVVGAMLGYPNLFRQYYSDRLNGLFPLATGRSGAVILGLLGKGALWSAPKGYGAPWNGTLPEVGTEVALVDDCIFTGMTMAALEHAVRSEGLQPVKKIVVWPYQPLH